MKNDGGPAFPIVFNSPSTGPEYHDGMSLRDYFAAAALPAVIVRYEALTQVDDHAAPVSPSAAVEMAYRYADAAIIERERS